MKIIIKKPCSENWNAMTPNEQGRFCDACEKTVVDFSKMSDLEIYHALHNRTGKVCGRLSVRQIENFNAAHEEFPSPSNLKKWSLAAMLAGVLAYPSLTQPEVNFQNSLASVMPMFGYAENIENQSSTSNTVPVGDSVLLSGKVTESQRNTPLVGAIIQVVGTNIVATTDADGKFSLKVPKSDKAIILIAQYDVDYSSKTKSIVPQQSASKLLFVLEYDRHSKMLMGDVMFVPSNK